MFKFKFVKNIYNVVIIGITILNIYNIILGNIVYCDSESISELYFSYDNNTPNIGVESNNQSRFSVQTRESSNLPFWLDLRERMKRNISWHLFSKKFVSYPDFKKNWYPSRSLKRQLKTELKDLFDHPYKYSVHKREWILINNYYQILINNDW